jgi:all-trans-retinol dehydrogenase (NAD+)
MTAPNLTYHKCDLTSQSDIEETCTTILNSSPPTVLINNAGIAKLQTIMDTTQEWLQKEFTINLFCHYTLIQKRMLCCLSPFTMRSSADTLVVLPKMLENKKGHIVTIASLASYISIPGLVDCEPPSLAISATPISTQLSPSVIR